MDYLLKSYITRLTSASKTALGFLLLIGKWEILKRGGVDVKKRQYTKWVVGLCQSKQFKKKKFFLDSTNPLRIQTLRENQPQYMYFEVSNVKILSMKEWKYSRVAHIEGKRITVVPDTSYYDPYHCYPNTRQSLIFFSTNYALFFLETKYIRYSPVCAHHTEIKTI